jgi:dissimilatory sulfite reductase (desulfoviridin) alpha/beta subunit
MLYPKSNERVLDKSLFELPTSEYRAAPFWAWNGELKTEELLEQIDIFRKMGNGGFHMHARTGLTTPYLSDEFMERVRECVEKAK